MSPSAIMSVSTGAQVSMGLSVPRTCSPAPTGWAPTPVSICCRCVIRLVAHQLIDVAGLAPGRFLFGVGIGGEDPHEVKICGVDPRSRGRRMDECMHVVRGLLTGKALDFDGEFFTIGQAQLAPLPAEALPIVVGGRSDAAIDRAGRLGDGWFGIWVSARRYAEAVAQMAAPRMGRDERSSGGSTPSMCGAASAGRPRTPAVTSPPGWKPSTRSLTSGSRGGAPRAALSTLLRS